MGLKSLKKEPSLAEKAYTAIKEAIISNELAPGTALAEETLAAHLGISRTPIRTALQRLQLEGVVTSSGKKLIVAEVTGQDVRDIDAVRTQLEPLSIQLIAQNGGLTAKQLKMLQTCNDRLQAAAQQGDNLAFLEQDVTFHITLAQLSGNGFLADLVQRSNLMIQRFHTLTGTLARYAPTAAEEHTAILQALAEQDYPKAETALRTHLEHVDSRILQN